MPKLLPREVCLGAGCLIYTDKGWRRAVVVNFITQTTNYDVRFIDTGEIDVVPLNCVSFFVTGCCYCHDKSFSE